jgi:hypothetical protein
MLTWKVGVIGWDGMDVLAKLGGSCFNCPGIIDIDIVIGFG